MDLKEYSLQTKDIKLLKLACLACLKHLARAGNWNFSRNVQNIQKLLKSAVLIVRKAASAITARCSLSTLQSHTKGETCKLREAYVC